MNRHALFLDVAQRFSRESTCTRGHVGAVIVKDRRIISTGYNGAPANLPHCDEVGCDLTMGPDAGCQRAIHAEANAISYAVRAGVRVEGATMYCTAGPCLKCAQLIVAAGIIECVYLNPYRKTDGVDLLWACNVTTTHLK